MLPPISLPIRENGALYQAKGGAKLISLTPIAPELLIPPSGEFNPYRHRQQMKGLTALGEAATPESLPGTTPTAGWEALPYSEHCRRYGELNVTVTSYSGKSLFQHQLYLFNVLVALEWIPSHNTLEQLIFAFQAASNFLFDASNGWMAFGQVVFGGLELMGGADIQIMASNRLHPRSWLDGLNDPEKYMPIRVGRGVWTKNDRILIPWDEPVAFRSLIHEWGHYALNLLDEYLDTAKPYVRRSRWPHKLLDEDQAKERNIAVPSNAPRLVTPKISLSAESIMATLNASEIVPQQRLGENKRTEEIRQRFPGVDLSGEYNQGPHQLPVPLPCFYTSNDEFGSIAMKHGEEQQIDVDDIKLDHCWMYLLRWQEQEGGNRLQRLIAQGSIDSRGRGKSVPGEEPIIGAGFRLLGFQKGDQLLFIGHDQRGMLNAELHTVNTISDDRKPKTQPVASVTPAALPVVTVIPDLVQPPSLGGNTIPITRIKVRIFGEEQPDEVWICPLGQSSPWPLQVVLEDERRGRESDVIDVPRGWVSDFFDVPHLDGHVLVRWKATGARTEQFMVYDYSQGGGPDSHIKAPEPPITAGSSDGNVMFFFTPNGKDDRRNIKYSEIRIVTTRNYSGFERENAIGEPRSYLFSVASSAAIPAAELSPTLVMNFDVDALDDERDLSICRYDEPRGTWEQLPTYQPDMGFYAAIPLEARQGVQPLDPGKDRPIEHYRLFLV